MALAGRASGRSVEWTPTRIANGGLDVVCWDLADLKPGSLDTRVGPN